MYSQRMPTTPPPPESKAEERSGLRSLVRRVAGTLLLLVVGGAIAFGLGRGWWGVPYRWDVVQETDNRVAAGVGLISATLLILWILFTLGKLKFRLSFQTLVSASVIWIGFGTALLVPAVSNDLLALGSNIIWVRETHVVGSISAALLILWILLALGKLKFRFSFQTLVSVSMIWIGFGAGLLAPATVIPVPEADATRDTTTIDSVVYQMELNPLAFPDELDEFLGARPGPYIASTSLTHHYAILNNDAKTWLTEDSENDSGRVAFVSFSSLSNLVNVDGWVVLTDLNPRIQHVRDLQLTNSGIAFTNVELKDDCFTLQVWQAGLSEGIVKFSDLTMLWESSPCLTWDKSPERISSYEQLGARIHAESSGDIIVAVGDYRMGPTSPGEYEGRPDLLGPSGSYGKILRIKPDGSEQVISTGHRNPQGLVYNEKTNRLWVTEHGPKGGGELNHVILGKDYGWPDVTYGIPYSPNNLPQGDWEIGRWGSNHDGFEKPRLAWMPSVGPSQLLVYRGEEFPGWQGDLLVATMRDESIRRIRLDGNRVVFDERIEVGDRNANFRRIRDMVELEDGRILLAFDSGKLAVLSMAQVL